MHSVFRGVALSVGLLSAAIALAAEWKLPPAGGLVRQAVTSGADGRAAVRFEVPFVDIQEVWMPNLRAPDQGRKWKVGLESAPQADMPYVAFLNAAGQNVFSFGSRSLEFDNRLSAKLNQEKGVFEVALEVAAGKGRTLPPFEVTLDRRALPWTQVLREWRDALGYPHGTYPDAAWHPVYCSWYAVHAAVTQEWTERTAAIAADLGFGTFILDDGWSYDEAKRVNPKTLPTWYRDVGQWDAFSSVKFPDFAAHRAHMRQLGLNYMVWTAPFFVGTRAEAFRRLGFDTRADKVPFEGNVLLDVDNAAQLADVKAQFLLLLEKTDLDGLKIDFLDYIRPSVDTPHGADVLAFVRELTEALRAKKPNLLLEFRQSYANPVTASCATQFRAGDVPFEWMDNLRRILQIRLQMGDGIPIHADPICWAPEETADNVNRHFMAAMAGVPMVSMGLEKLSDDEKDLVRKWLAYYAQHVEPFQRRGKWDVCYRNGGVAYAIAETEDGVLVIVNDPDAVPRLNRRIGGRTAVILNLTYETLRFASGVAIAPATAFPSLASFLERNLNRRRGMRVNSTILCGRGSGTNDT